MLSMVSSSDHRGADMHITNRSAAVVEQENYGALERSSADDNYDSYRRHDSTRGVLTATSHTASNVLPSGSSQVSGGAESDASSKARKEKRSTKSKCPPGLRSGKWTLEEEAFTNLLIHYFKRGLLHVDDGTSLRWYLAKRLNCEAMRVTKKLKGNSSIGKQIFRALEATDENAEAIAAAASELAVVEAQFIESLAALAAPAATAATINGASVQTTRGKKAARADASSSATRGLQHVVRADSADSADAQLLLHFINEAHDTLLLEVDDMDDSSNKSKSDRKRQFSEVETTTSAEDNDDTCDIDNRAQATAASKRHAVKIENLMD